MTACWIDGVAGDQVPVSDRGLMYGDGLFETMRCQDGAPRFLELHLRRLQAGCVALGMPEPELDQVRREIGLAAATGGPCIVRFTLTRGSSATRGYAPPVPAHPRRIVVRYPSGPDSAAVHGIRACMSAVEAGMSRALAGVKHLNRLENVLARAQLAGTGCDEAIMATASGALVGGTMSNLFAVLGGRLVTPPIDVAGVRGVMRSVVLREAGAAGLEAREQPLALPDLAAASEIFFTNSRIGLWPVRTFEGWRAEAPGPVVGALRQRIAPLRD